MICRHRKFKTLLNITSTSTATSTLKENTYLYVSLQNNDEPSIKDRKLIKWQD